MSSKFLKTSSFFRKGVTLSVNTKLRLYKSSTFVIGTDNDSFKFFGNDFNPCKLKPLLKDWLNASALSRPILSKSFGMPFSDTPIFDNKPPLFVKLSKL